MALFFYLLMKLWLIVTTLVAIPTDVIARIDRYRVSIEIRIPPNAMTIKSSKKIINPTFIAKAFAIICANISAPLTLVLFLSINPIPMPIKTPPIIELVAEDKRT